jgi:putative transposase
LHVSVIREEEFPETIAMDLLYRLGGLKGRRIGNMIDVDYSTVSVSRKRLRGEIQKAIDLKKLLFRIEAKLSKLKN